MKRTKIIGKVVTGKSYGRELGYPTINLDSKQYISDKLDLKEGIYAGLVKLNGQQYLAGVVISLDEQNIPLIEAHLLGFEGNLYNKEVTLVVEKFISNFQTFKNEKDLVSKIKADIEQIKLYYVHRNNS
jgi:riboflavin kinase / FMN adenylyltransferase